jgi:hypothetical protein
VLGLPAPRKESETQRQWAEERYAKNRAEMLQSMMETPLNEGQMMHDALSQIGQARLSHNGSLALVTGHLQDLEDLLHQYDNAVDFAHMGGITVVLTGLTEWHKHDTQNDYEAMDVAYYTAWVLGNTLVTPL